MKTITIQIGNTDQKLSIAEWSAYVKEVQRAVNLCLEPGAIHFSGGSSNWEPWVNYCWVINIDENGTYYQVLKEAIQAISKIYRQDSVAWTEGETKFI